MAAPMRTLGRSELQVSALGVGCWAMGGHGWAGGADDAESIRALHTALDRGINLFDTADVYGFGRSERVLGQALRGRRDQAVIATKFSNVWDPDTDEWLGLDATPEHARRALEASLRRLQTDYIDLYQLHHGSFGPEGAVELREALEELVLAGKIRWYGWSTDFPDRAQLFAQGTHCTAIQADLNVLSDAPEIRQVCDDYDLAILNRSPLATGLLSGKYDEHTSLPPEDARGWPDRPEWMRFFAYGRPDSYWLGRLRAVIEVLRSDGRTPAQGALAWLWARSERHLPIPGFRSVAQLEENCQALEFGPLSSDQLAEIDKLLER